MVVLATGSSGAQQSTVWKVSASHTTTVFWFWMRWAEMDSKDLGKGCYMVANGQGKARANEPRQK